VIEEDLAEPATEETGDPPPAGSGRTLIRSLALLCTVFLAAVIVLSIVAVNQRDARKSAVSDRHSVEVLASQFAQQLLSYDYTHFDDTKAKVLALAAGKFRDDYQQQFPALKELITSAQAKQEGHPKEVYVSASDANNAKVIVVSDIATTGKAGPRSRVDAYIQLTMLKVGGRWKVVDVTDLNFSQAASGGTPGAATTTTVAPGK
jgi:Mce-associated membrane protein